MAAMSSAVIASRSARCRSATRRAGGVAALGAAAVADMAFSVPGKVCWPPLGRGPTWTDSHPTPAGQRGGRSAGHLIAPVALAAGWKSPSPRLWGHLARFVLAFRKLL